MSVEIFEVPNLEKKRVRLQEGMLRPDGTFIAKCRVFLVAVDETGRQLDGGVLAEVSDKGVELYRNMETYDWPKEKIQ